MSLVFNISCRTGNKAKLILSPRMCRIHLSFWRTRNTRGYQRNIFFIQKLNQLLKNRVSIYTIYTQQSVEYEQSDRRRSWSFVQQIDTIVASGEIWSFYTSTRDSALWRLSTRIFLFVAICQIMIPNVIPIPVIIKKISK